MRDEIRRLVQLLCYVAFLVSIAPLVLLVFAAPSGVLGAKLGMEFWPACVVAAPFLLVGFALGICGVAIDLLHQIAQRLEHIEELLAPRPVEGTKVLTGGLQLKFPDKPTT